MRRLVLLIAAFAVVLATSTTADARMPKGLTTPKKREIAMELVSSAENSSLDWRAQFGYLEDIDDGRGYTGGIIGFCSGTGDMLQVVRLYRDRRPHNGLVRFIPALRRVNGTASHRGLGSPFVRAWKHAAHDRAFRGAQLHVLNTVYFDPAVRAAKRDGLHALGQFIYYDAMVMHGPGRDHDSFGGLRARARAEARTPARGGSEVRYLDTFLRLRRALMRSEDAHENTSRIDDEQRRFLREHNLALRPPLVWHTYGDRWVIR